MLLAAAAGLALSASGCIIDSSSSPPPTCLPDLTVFWQIRSNLTGGNPLLTCAQAGNADTVTAWIDNPSFAESAFDVPCPANQTGGSFLVELPRTGNYNISLELTSGAGTVLLSETPILVQPVDCSGLSATPVADLYVNF
jgi:hypothetical protein